MPIAIADLPPIVDLLAVEGEPRFVILGYPAFIRVAVHFEARHAPDVVAVLDCAGEHAFVVLDFEGFRRAVHALTVTGSIDERHYLEKYPDVARAVAAGTLRNGTEHYLVQGYFERRAAREP